MTKILETTHGISKLFQSPQCNLSKANDLIKSSHEKLQSMQNDTILSAILLLSWQRLGALKITLKISVLKKAKQLFVEVCHDESSASTKKCSRVDVFLAMVDRACGQITQRFLSFS